MGGGTRIIPKWIVVGLLSLGCSGDKNSPIPQGAAIPSVPIRPLVGVANLTPMGVTGYTGDPTTLGNLDGPWRSARFGAGLWYLACDGAGNRYITDSSNQTIRKIDPNGMVTTFAGKSGISGYLDGLGINAYFYDPIGIAIDGAGNAFVGDSGNKLIRKITPSGSVSLFAGRLGVAGQVDGPLGVATFNSPQGMAFGDNGNLYVADQPGTIRRVAPNGTVTTLAGAAGTIGSSDGSGWGARFGNTLGGLAFHPSGLLFVADTSNYTIRQVNVTNGNVTTLAGTPKIAGTTDGVGSSARMQWTYGLSLAGDFLYAAEAGSALIRQINTLTGEVLTIAGTPNQAGWVDGPAGSAKFNNPSAILWEPGGGLLVSDHIGGTIRFVQAGQVSTLFGASPQSGFQDGPLSSARFNRPSGLTMDPQGNLWVMDTGNHAIRGLVSGKVVTLAGGSPGTADGLGGAARFNSPQGSTVGFDSQGYMYVADTANHTIRKISPTGDVATFAGAPGQPGYADGLGSDARFNWPHGVAVAPSGDIYVADMYNEVIRKIRSDGTVSTLAGTPGISGGADGAASSATFNLPSSITIDPNGNLIVTDLGGGSIRKITPRGRVSTMAGAARKFGDSDGSGTKARFNHPRATALGPDGTIYVADWGNHLVRTISPSGRVGTLAGTRGKWGFVPGQTPSTLYQPFGLAWIGNGYLAVCQGNGIAIIGPIP